MAEEKKTTEEVKTSKDTKVDAKKTAHKKPVSKEPEKSSRFAVIKTGGKQYVVEEGRYYEFEKIAIEEGKPVVFEEVLLVADGSKVQVGEPVVTGAKVTGKMLEQTRDDKVLVLKYKAKKRYRKKTGHRQHKSRVMIEKIA